MPRFRSHAVSALVIVVVLVAGSCGGGAAGGATTASSTTATTAPPASTTRAVTTSAADQTTSIPAAVTTAAPTPPSQSEADALRDGVIAEVAALPFDLRVDVIQAVSAPEGVWVISQLTDTAAAGADGCRLGPEGGRYPTDFICTSEYGELLLLDEGMSEILRAYPFSGVPPELLELGPDAVYCGRNGELPLPDSMVCRVDRTTLEPRVRVFPPGIDSVVVQPCFYPPATWSVDEHPLEVLAFEVGAGELAVRTGDGSWTSLDTRTLEILEAGVSP